MEDCAFCEIIKSTREAAQVYIDDDHVAFMDRFPINPGHLLVVPKKHYSTLMKMSPEEVAELFKVVLKLSKAVLGATHANGLNIGQNNGRAARQLVPHVHVHIIPRYQDDSPDGHWPSRRPSELLELKRIASSIRRELQ